MGTSYCQTEKVQWRPVNVHEEGEEWRPLTPGEQEKSKWAIRGEARRPLSLRCQLVSSVCGETMGRMHYNRLGIL